MGFFEGDVTEDDETVINALVKLRKRLVGEITTTQTANMPKMVWKNDKYLPMPDP